jgi:hypothetical protein
MTFLKDIKQRWQIAVDGKPVSPVFPSWDEAAKWVVGRGLGTLEPLAALGSKSVVLVHKKPFETWMDHDIAAFELSEIV